MMWGRQVLLLQAVVTALQQDLSARLSVFRAVSSSHASAAAEDESARPALSSMQALILHSHLWRLLQVMLTSARRAVHNQKANTRHAPVPHCRLCVIQLLPSKGISVDASRDRLIQMLLQWIAAPAVGSAQQAPAYQLTTATVAELGGRLLNAVMTLYGVKCNFNSASQSCAAKLGLACLRQAGVRSLLLCADCQLVSWFQGFRCIMESVLSAEAAEDAGLGVGSARLRFGVDEGNDRAVIDRAIVAHLVGPKPTLLTWAQRSAVLAALHTRHRLRVLSLVRVHCSRKMAPCFCSVIAGVNCMDPL